MGFTIKFLLFEGEAEYKSILLLMSYVKSLALLQIPRKLHSIDIWHEEELTNHVKFTHYQSKPLFP